MTHPQLQTGGPVAEERVYLLREADSELLESLLSGEFCTLFAPRQQGKTSLLHRTKRALEENGVCVAMIDIGMLSPATSTSKELFEFLIDEIGGALGIASNVATARGSAGFVSWLSQAVVASPCKIVVLIDEVHQMLSNADLAEELLQSLRVLVESRVSNPLLEKFGVCIAGVTRLCDLVRNLARDPSAITKQISLNDFSRDEITPLGTLLAVREISNSTLDVVYQWTSGQPFMTLKLMRELVMLSHETANIDVARVVRERILDDAYAAEPYIADARTLFDDHSSYRDIDLNEVVNTYRRMLNAEEVTLDEVGDKAIVLILAGVARRESSKWLVVRNKIIATLFNERWVDAQEFNRALAIPFQQWVSARRSPERLLSGYALKVASATAKTAELVTPEQRCFVIESIEFDAKLRIEDARHAIRTQLRSEITHTAELARRRSLWAASAVVVAVVLLGVLAVLARNLQVERAAVTNIASDAEAAKAALRTAADAQKAVEDQRLREFNDLQLQSERAQQSFEQALSTAQHATSDQKALADKAAELKLIAKGLKNDVDAARKDYETAKSAQQAAETRASAAEQSLQTAAAALTAEVAARKDAEQRLSDEKLRSATVQKQLDESRAQAACTPVSPNGAQTPIPSQFVQDGASH